MLVDRPSLARTVSTFLLALALSTSAAAQDKDRSAVAHELDRSAGKLLEDAAGSGHAFSPAASKFVESLDEFAGSAHEYATGKRSPSRDAATIRRLAELAEQVTAAMMLAHVSPDIHRLWGQTRELLHTLRGQGNGVRSPRGAFQPAGGASAVRPVRRVSPPGPSGLRPAAHELHRAADNLHRAVQDLHLPGQTDRETLLFKSRHLAQNARTLDDLAETTEASDPRIARALDQVDFYADRVEHGISELHDPGPMRAAHEAFSEALAGAHAALAPAPGRGEGKPRQTKPRHGKPAERR